MNPRSISLLALLGFLVSTVMAGCAGRTIPTQPPQPPDEYLSNTLDWIETHSIKIDTVDWARIREDALALAPNPQTTADAYPAILFVMKQLGDAATWFSPPGDHRAAPSVVGFNAFYPEAVIIAIDPGGPAEKAGLQIGDVLVSINNAPPKQWEGTPFLDLYEDATLQITVRRAGQDQPINVMLTKAKFSPHQSTPTGRTINADRGSVGYLDLAQNSGEGIEGALYPTLAQEIIRNSDQEGACGWIIDLRRNSSGDIWSYIAAIGPILGEGEVGGFSYLDGKRELWTYKDGKVFWADRERNESLVEGTVYKLDHPAPPVALLTSHATMAAGELAVVAFKGRPNVRVFGEPTGGSPFLVFHTLLSDGSFLGVSAADAMDRTGQVYEGPIAPDEVVSTDWTLFGSDRDPVILTARDWLLSQSDCEKNREMK
jgi:C-terminal processing protease CtpA/Prc